MVPLPVQENLHEHRIEYQQRKETNCESRVSFQRRGAPVQKCQVDDATDGYDTVLSRDEFDRLLPEDCLSVLFVLTKDWTAFYDAVQEQNEQHDKDVECQEQEE